MARKADDLLADLDQLASEEQTTIPRSKAKTGEKGGTVNSADAGEDAFADIEEQLKTKPATSASRPDTPRLSSSATSVTNKSEKRVDYTPASTSVGSSQRNSSEDRVRTHPGPTGAGATAPASDVHDESQKRASGGAGGGWWGSMFSAATAAVKQAESLAKDIRANEDAQRWAEQFRGNIQNLQSLGTDLRSRALPTFTSIISHIAPPISAHERLQIHTTHDIVNYPSLDPIIYSVFSRVMAQVEGGDLLVIQRGSESRGRRSSSEGYRGGVLGGGTSWTDGPWWRDEGMARSLGAVPGLREGTRLARASAEAYAKEFFDARGGLEQAAQRATETLSESNPVRTSDIFLAIQAVHTPADKELFVDSAAAAAAATTTDSAVVDPQDPPADALIFAVYLYDPIHSISFHGLSQSFPQRWAEWLDADPGADAQLPESIAQIIQSGAVDPREWVAEWIEEVLSLVVGVVAQQYVAKRMGVGEGGLGRGKRPAVEDGMGGEAARAI